MDPEANLTATETLTAILMEARKRQDREPRYGVSDATACARAHVWNFREFERDGRPGTNEAPVRWRMAQWIGTAVGAELEAAAGRLEDLRTQVPVVVENDQGLDIRGTADLVGSEFVADFKVVGDSAWKDTARAPKPEHWIQVQTYARALKKPRSVLFYIRNVARGEVPPTRIFEGDTDPAYTEIVVSHWADVDAHRALGTTPPRFREPKLECKTCRHAAACWETT